MFPASFHTFCRNGPCCGVKVKLGPQRAPDFAGSASREYQKFQGKPRGGMRAGCLNPADRFADFRIRQRLVMFLLPPLLWQCRTNGVDGIIVAVALGNGPAHDRTDALAHPPCGFALRIPDWRDHTEHVAGPNGVNALAHERPGVVAQTGTPLRFGLRAFAPNAALYVQHLFERLGERRHRGTFCPRIAAATSNPAVRLSGGPRFGERQPAHRAEPDVPPLACNGDPLHIGLARPALAVRYQQE